MTNVIDLNKAKTFAQLEAEQKRSHLDPADIKARLHADAQRFVEWLFSGRALCRRDEARIGDVNGTPGASLSIALNGPSAGLWKDHATGESGDLIALYMASMGYQDGRNFQLALKEIASEFLGDHVQVERPSWSRASAKERIEEKKQALGDKPRADMLELGAPVATWKYLDTNGNVIASTVRHEPDGTAASKTYRPWHFKTVDGRPKWSMGAPSLRPLYRLPEIVLASTVVLCEGEKCADALASVGIEATTAMQGAEAPVEKTDWSPLHGKHVVVWPDNDAPGLAYGRRVAERLVAIGCTVRVVAIPVGMREKWDAADCIAEGGDAHALVAGAIPFTEAPKPRVRILDLDELENIRPPSWLIEGILTDNGLAVLWGRSGDLKSFVGVDMGLCVASGAPWHGKPVRNGLVVYLAAEGSTGLAKRALGWWRTRGKDGPKPRFKLIPHSLAIAGDDLDALVEALDQLGEKPVLIIIDTLARTFGTGDENKQADMNAYVNAADRLRDVTKATVMIIHHSGVHEDKRERGSNVLRGAADTVIKVARNGDKLSLINRAPEGKQKDAEEFETIKLRTQKVSYVHHQTEHATLILNLDDDPTPEGVKDKKPDIGSNEQAILDALRAASAPLGFMRLHAMTKINKGSLSRSLASLADKSLVSEHPETRLWSPL